MGLEKLTNTPWLPALLTITSLAMLTVFSASANAQSPPAEPLFVRAAVDIERPYLSQQITYVFSIFQGPGLDTGSMQVTYESPTFAGFWNSEKVEQEEYSTTIDSREYHVIELRTLLFPTVIGSAVIEPGALTVSKGDTGEGQSIMSDAVPVHVRPLPAGAVSGFTGAVGSFNVSAHVATTSTGAGEPIDLEVIVSGVGNFDTLPEPDWPDFDGWRVVRLPVTSETQVSDRRVVGRRIYAMSLIPEKPGNLSIPEIGYHHFDPDTGEYVETTTSPIAVSVAGMDGLPAVTSNPDVDTTSDGRDTSIRPIKPVPPSLRQQERKLEKSQAYWAAWGIPPLMIAGALLWRRRRATREAARAELLRRSALPHAQAALAQAAASGIDPRAASANALLSYLSTRLELIASGMTRKQLIQHLSEAGADFNLTQRVEDILSVGEALRYGPSQEVLGGRRGQIEQTAQLLSDLEEVIDP